MQLHMHLRFSLPTGKLMKWGDVPQQSHLEWRRWRLECRGGTGRGMEVRDPAPCLLAPHLRGTQFSGKCWGASGRLLGRHKGSQAAERGPDCLELKKCQYNFQKQT